jgi:serine/threonine protein kinase
VLERVTIHKKLYNQGCDEPNFSSRARVTHPFALPVVGDLLAEKYRILRVVADGGMGVVFEAHHELLGKNVALKFPLPELAHLPKIVERFLAEARLCARIENEHVVRVLDVSKVEGLPYIVMELVTGASLASEMGQAWPPARAAAYAVQVLEGLEAVHALGVVHRDVKPENVLVIAMPRGPLLKLIDFGIAKDSIAQEAIGRLTHAGAMLGTPAYMAPEQIADPMHAGSAADLYSVGILLFEMLAGASPFSGVTLDALTEQALGGRLRPLLELAPDTPPGLVEIVTRATALRAADRFASASDFKRALLPFAQGGPPAVLPTLPPEAAFEPAVQTKTVLRTFVAEPPVATFLAEPPAMREAPLPVNAQASEQNRARLLASVALGAILLFGLVGVAWAVHKHQSAEQNVAPPPLAMAAPETDIAPLASESAEPSSGGAPAKRAEVRVVAPMNKQPSAQTLSVVQADNRRFFACNADGTASEIVVELHIADDGSVRSASPVSSTASPAVTECVLAQARSLQFPAHSGADEIARVPVQLPAATEEPPQRERRQRPDWVPGRERRRRPIE